MVQAAIETNFTCSCGSPLVVMTVDPAPDDKITALLMCPRHRVGHHLTLDHSAIDLWVGVVADHLYRCAICGRPLTPVTNVTSSEVATTFTLACPIHGTQNNTRTVWSVLYRRIFAEIQEQRRSQLVPTPITTTAPKAVETEQKSPPTQYCPQCGKKIRPKDNFCFICGSAID